MSLYDELGLSPHATPAEIAIAHRAAAKRTHPDQGGDAEAFQRVQHAAIVLRDPERRARYDETGDDGTAPDNTLTRRTELVVQAFDLALSNAKASAPLKDIVAMARQALLDDIKEAEGINAAHRAQIATFGDVMSRLTLNGQQESPLHIVMQERIRKLTRAIAENEIQIGHAKAATEMVSEYAWRRDAPPPPPTPPNWAAQQPHMGIASALDLRNMF